MITVENSKTYFTPQNVLEILKVEKTINYFGVSLFKVFGFKEFNKKMKNMFSSTAISTHIKITFERKKFFVTVFNDENNFSKECEESEIICILNSLNF